MIYCLGDSHVSFIGHNDGAICPELESVLKGVYKYVVIQTAFVAYSIVDCIVERVSGFKLTPQDWLLFNFGEVDVRFYMSKDVHEGRDPMVTFHKGLESYENFIIRMKDFTQNIVICGIWPQAIEEHELIPERGFLPREVRDNWSILFNDELKKISERQNTKFMNLRPYLLKDGVVDRNNYVEDLIHLKHTCTPFFKQELEKTIGVVLEYE